MFEDFFEEFGDRSPVLGLFSSLASRTIVYEDQLQALDQRCGFHHVSSIRRIYQASCY